MITFYKYRNGSYACPPMKLLLSKRNFIRYAAGKEVRVFDVKTRKDITEESLTWFRRGDMEKTKFSCDRQEDTTNVYKPETRKCKSCGELTTNYFNCAACRVKSSDYSEFLNGR